MLRTFENTRPYAQPLAAIEVRGKPCALPPDFVQGLDFLRRFTVSHHEVLRWVYLVDGRLYAASNSMIIDYEIGSCELEDSAFLPLICRILAGFYAPPDSVVIDYMTYVFTWDDGQELLVDCSNTAWRPVSSVGDRIKDMIAGTFKRHWSFGEVTHIDDETRESLKRSFDGRGNGDIFFDGQTAIYRNDTRTSEHLRPFPSNTEGLIRFDRKPFLAMLKVATEIDFSASPLCFRHAHGRGMLVRRTLGRDVPTFGGEDG
ncbi:MAG: hypothetical protein LCH92_12435 [Proteobacteria bacterium]|nr:hypothetical protein [Pseudomonadota bacterium]